MSTLNEIEIEMIGAAGSGNNIHHGDPTNNSASQNWRGGGYGGQANGFVSNTAAAGQGLGQGVCSDGLFAGIKGGLAGFVIGVIGGAIGGRRFVKDDKIKL